MNMKHSVKTGVKRHKLAVWRRDSKGEVTFFDSVKEAAKITGCFPQNISDCLCGKTNTCAGYTWGYVKEKNKKEARTDIPSMKIKGYPNYLIYNNGQIYSKNTNQYLRPPIVNGYYIVNLSHNNVRAMYRVHRLIAQHFCENPDNKPIVNHIDGNKLNNHYANLEWVTHSENSRHANVLGLNKRIRRVCQYTIKGKYLRTFNNCREAAEFLKLKNLKSGMSNISKACIGISNTSYKYKWAYEKEIV